MSKLKQLTKLQLLDITGEDHLPVDHELHHVPLARFLQDALVPARSQSSCRHIGRTMFDINWNYTWSRLLVEEQSMVGKETYPGDPASGKSCAALLHWIHKVRSEASPVRLSALFVVVSMVTITHQLLLLIWSIFQWSSFLWPNNYDRLSHIYKYLLIICQMYNYTMKCLQKGTKC